MSKISVALAYYNGGRYIDLQLTSILKQLSKDDEVIISVDGANDGSMEWLKEKEAGDARIRVIEGPGKGVVKNFEHAISHCSGDIIFLSDQDDVWMDYKVEKVLRGFEKARVSAILHNAALIDENGDSCDELTMFDYRHSQTGMLKNVIKNSYVGCCMAFKKELVDYICPIPDKMYMHDFWIGMIAEQAGGVGLIKEPLIGYRRHSENVTDMTHGSLSFMIKKRIDIIRCLFELKRRVG